MSGFLRVSFELSGRTDEKSRNCRCLYSMHVIQHHFLATITIMQLNSYANPHSLNIERKLLLWLYKTKVKSCNRLISFSCYVMFSLYLSIFECVQDALWHGLRVDNVIS